MPLVISRCSESSINQSDFSGVAGLDKSKPVFLYCLSGSRSSSAMGYLMQIGFKEVYNLQRGTLSWQSAGLALESSSSPSSNPTMTLAQLKGLSANNKTILVDFYAEWCGPCKKMEPFLAEIAKEKAGQVQVVRVDVDANPALAQELKIEAIPYLQVYKNQNVTWSNIGLVSKDDVVKNL
ncbi:MAG: redoxin family protein [Cytophagaceae bacterium]|nr:redoxin family protein [Cytophagaceae bacterium]